VELQEENSKERNKRSRNRRLAQASNTFGIGASWGSYQNSDFACSSRDHFRIARKPTATWKYADIFGPASKCRAGRVICCLPANEPKNHFERNRVPERCLLFGILGVGWPFPFHATKSERCMVECRNRRGCAVLVANVLDFGIIVGPDFRVVWVESMDIGGNSGPCFVCGSSTHDFVDSLVNRCMTQRVAHISICNLTNGCPQGSSLRHGNA
jgi:hypothetical protein